MSALSNEKFTPTDQVDSDDPVSFEIKALTSLQLTEVTMDGMKERNGAMVMGFDGIRLLLKYGLVKTSDISKMTTAQHMQVGMAIYNKAILSEDERKNS